MNVPTTTIQVAYPVTLAQVSAQLDKLRGISFVEAYKSGVEAIKVCRELRGSIEERRKYLKADSLAYGREVDRVAGILTTAIEAVEGPLKVDKAAVDDAKRRAKEAEAQAERDRIEAELRARRAEEEKALADVRKAEEKVLATRRAELEAMKAEIAKEREAADRARAEAATEREELLLLRRRAEVDAADREAERRAVELAARKIEEAKEAELRRQEFEKDQAKRRAALLPDQQRLVQYARAIRAVFEQSPEELSDEAQAVSDAASNKIGEAIDMLEEWQP